MSPLRTTQGAVLPITCMLLGTCISVFVWGRNSEERNYLTQQLNKFQSLEPDQKKNVQKSYALLKSMPARKQTEIEQIHHQTQENPELQETMDRYFEWWSSLSQAEWDSFEELSADERLTFVKSRWRKSTEAAPEEIVVEFTGPPSVRMPTLRLSFEDYWSIISETVPDEHRDETLRKELEQLKSDKHRALLLTLTLFERFSNPAQRRELDQPGDLLKTAMLRHIKDEAWLTKFRAMAQDLDRKPFGRAWMFMTASSMLDKATIALGDDLRKQFPVTSEQILAAFESLPNETDADKSFKRELMTMSSDEARKRLELLAQTTSNQSPEQQLVNRYNKFIRDRQRFLRGQFGFGGPGMGPPPVQGQGPGPDRPRGEDGPPRRDSGRRPGQ
ncbi:MAG: hypothetical protein U0936_19325 [Planctomycetaceae bacterium]